MKKKGLLILLVLCLMSSTLAYAGDKTTEEKTVANAVQDGVAELGETNTETTEEVEIEQKEETGGNDLVETPEKEPEEIPEEKPVEKHYGWYFDQEQKCWFYYNARGNMQYGWQYIEGKWYYLNRQDEENPGVMVVDTKKTISGKDYFFNKSGVMLTGWVKRPEGWYYTDKSGAKITGWQYISKKWYYLDAKNSENPGLMTENEKKTISGKVYFFNKSGAMLTGWVRRSEGWYYTNKSGEELTGWQYISKKWYYLDVKNSKYPGLMVENGKKTISGKDYFFDKSGAMLTGWVKRSGSWYYANKSGAKLTGWQKISKTWYYLDSANEGKMVSNGWKKIGSKWYRFKSSGAMYTNWVKTGGKWYYLGSDGAARTGWKVVDGNWYYFYTANDSHGGPECAMAANVTIDGWKLTSSGAMVSSTETKMLAKAQTYTSSSRYLILVDRAACKVGIYSGKAGSWKQVKYWSCSPGKPSTPTVGGTFTVGAKGYYFDSGSARCFYYTQFKGNYLFHSVLYAQTKKPSKIIDGRLGMQLSHGCVRLDINNAKWIYDNIPRSTKVVVY